MTFLKYVAIQLLAYGIDMGLFLLVLKSGTFEPIVANIVAKIAAGIFAFIIHRNFTFRVGENTNIKNQAIRYFALLALNVPVASAIFALLLIWIIDYVYAKFIADIICVALTYALSKYFIFTDHQKYSANKNSTGADA